MTPEYIKDTMETTDGCSTPGLIKGFGLFLLWLARKNRNYTCFCRDHDVDFKHGPKYGVGFHIANGYLYAGVIASGHPKIAKWMYAAVNSWFGRRAWNKWRIKYEQYEWMV